MIIEFNTNLGIRRPGISRDDMFIETKVRISDYGYDATLHAFDKSAGKLGVDRIDLLLAQASVVPAVNQVEVHPYFQQRALQRLNAEHGILTHGRRSVESPPTVAVRSVPSTTRPCRRSRASTASWPLR